jgi:hypothetical protein
MEFRDLGIRELWDISGKHEKRTLNISHPDEIEKRKHFIGQADSHRRTQTKKTGPRLKAETRY